MLEFMPRAGLCKKMTTPPPEIEIRICESPKNKERPWNANARFVEDRQLHELRGNRKRQERVIGLSGQT
jgi:hypothetical protein